ncbi:MAG: 3'-5' exonuclease [Candidatus Anaerobiospirillum merdipullorum]|uniref:3'-5' exonuclease n=1 Tax=Candidatus Anaerobiospirillum merdipullorum TaxID=2838450 RepID=A0A9E2KM10_9GAMM|nr:3'-5' exonuclease [Candidatus Anaerobiospirillum merdipullorum]
MQTDLNFVALDFETANAMRSSVCSVGMVVVRHNCIVNTYYELIKPLPNYYQYWNTRVHGLTARDTDNAPTFAEIWPHMQELIGPLPLVAHNSPFDSSCLKAVLAAYQLPDPHYEFYCTLKAARRYFGAQLPNHKLDTVAAACGIDLSHHHHALDDARACAEIALKIVDFGKPL